MFSAKVKSESQIDTPLLNDLALEPVKRPHDDSLDRAIFLSTVYPRRLTILQDLAVAAFQCNKVQVFNLMLAGDGDGNGGWHSLSHHAENSGNPAKFKTAVQWQYDQFKQLLLKLNAVKEVDGTSLLYNSAVVMTSSISDGQTHYPADINVVVGGNLGGKLKTGQTIDFPAGMSKQPPMANVWLTLMRAFGMSNSSFGNSNGVITQMLA